VAWCRDKFHLPVVGYSDRVMFSDERKAEVVANMRVYVWRRAGAEWEPACPNTPKRKFGIMIRGCNTSSYTGMGTLAFVESKCK